MSPSSRTLASSLDKLSLSQPAKSSSKAKKAEPADSWEEDAGLDSPETDEGSGTATPVRPMSSSDYPGPPPPTPSSPSFSSSKTLKGSPYTTFPPYGFDGDFEQQSENVNSPAARRGGEDKRPEKSTAVASRLIAAGIGQRAPKRTKEEREYDQAMKVQEKKKRDQARAEEERRKAEKEKAKQAIWDD